jgi:hypothetical protein
VEDRKSSFFQSPAWFLLLAVISALFVLLTSKIDVVRYARGYVSLTLNLRWIFWLAMVLACLSLFQLLKLMGQTLHERHLLPSFLARMFEDSFISRYERTKHRLREMVWSRTGRITVAGAGILLLVTLLAQTKALHDDEVNSNVHRLVDAVESVEHVESGNQAVRLLRFITRDEGNYFQNRLRLVQDLKKFGVRAVLMSFRGVQFLPEDARYMRELDESGIVVFSTEYYYTRVRPENPLRDLLAKMGAASLDENTLKETIVLSRLKPRGAGFADTPYDLTLELLRMYNGYSRDLEAHQVGNVVQFGKHRIPVTSDGWMYSRNLDAWRPGDRLVYVDSLGRWMGYDDDRFFFRNAKTAGLKLLLSSKRAAVDIGDQLRGKIVILEDGFRDYSYTYPRAYAVALQSILDNNVIIKSDQGHIWLSLICLALAGFFAGQFRPTIAVPFIFILGLVALLACSYLYDYRNYLVDVFYPLLSTAIAMVTFPIIAMKREA